MAYIPNRDLFTKNLGFGKVQPEFIGWILRYVTAHCSDDYFIDNCAKTFYEKENYAEAELWTKAYNEGVRDANSNDYRRIVRNGIVDGYRAESSKDGDNCWRSSYYDGLCEVSGFCGILYAFAYDCGYEAFDA